MPRQPEGRRLHRHDDLATLDYIAQYQADHRGRSPSQRAIYRALHMSAPSVAHASVRRLVRGGLLITTDPEPGLAGEMEITDAGRERLQAWRAQRERLAPPVTPYVAGGASHLARGAA